MVTKIGYWLKQTQLPPCPGTCPGEFPSNKNPIIGTSKEEQIRATFIFFPVIYLTKFKLSLLQG